MSKDYLTTLAEFACASRLADLPASLRERGRWIIADSVGAIAGGMQMPEMKSFVAKHLAGRQPGAASVIGGRRDGGSAGRRAAQRHRRHLAGAGRGQSLRQGPSRHPGRAGGARGRAGQPAARCRRAAGADPRLRDLGARQPRLEFAPRLPSAWHLRGARRSGRGWQAEGLRPGADAPAPQRRRDLRCRDQPQRHRRRRHGAQHLHRHEWLFRPARLRDGRERLHRRARRRRLHFR